MAISPLCLFTTRIEKIQLETKIKKYPPFSNLQLESKIDLILNVGKIRKQKKQTY